MKDWFEISNVGTEHDEKSWKAEIVVIVYLIFVVSCVAISIGG